MYLRYTQTVGLLGALSGPTSCLNIECMDIWKPSEQCLFPGHKAKCWHIPTVISHFLHTGSFLGTLELKESSWVSSNKLTLISLYLNTCRFCILPSCTSPMWVSESLWHRERWALGTGGVGVGTHFQGAQMLFATLVLCSSYCCRHWLAWSHKDEVFIIWPSSTYHHLNKPFKLKR